MSEATVATKEYQLELWARVFFALLVAMMWGASVFTLVAQNVPKILALSEAAFFVTITLPLVDCILWRLRIDEQEVSHTVYGWRDFWPWEAFSCRVTEKVGKGTYVRNEWPWWRIGRKLRLSIDCERRKQIESLFDSLLTSCDTTRGRT